MVSGERARPFSPLPLGVPVNPVSRSRRPLALVSLGVIALLAGRVSGGSATSSAQEVHRAPVERTVVARKYSFSPARIEVQQDDIVKITLQADDIPHSFTIDQYRIAKRAAPGQPVTFEFRADQAGSFVFYCNLSTDEKCKDMRGELVVRANR